MRHARRAREGEHSMVAGYVGDAFIVRCVIVDSDTLVKNTAYLLTRGRRVGSLNFYGAILVLVGIRSVLGLTFCNTEITG